MADAPLDPESRALWRRVAETVRPLKGRRGVRKPPAPKPAEPPVRPEPAEGQAANGPLATLAQGSLGAKTTRVTRAGNAPNGKDHGRNTLDASWDKRLRQGSMPPDFTIDLHGHTVAAAHTALETQLAHAIARHARLVLLITGRPPPPGRSRLDNPLRGVIRASIADWLHHSRHAGHIAAVRNAHPKHGGPGALYVILRRRREPV